MNNEQLASEKIVDAHPNLNDLKVPRRFGRTTIERASRFVAIAI